MTGLLAGRLALVTGAGSGIGRAVCQVFAREGAKVAAVDVNEQGIQETIASIQGENHAFPADISSSAAVNGLLKDIRGHFDSVPSLAVNCAGITRDAFFLKMTEEKYDQVMDVNLKGTFLICQAVAKLLVESQQKNGSLINISSTSGKVGNAGQANYAASKAGVVGLTKTIAKELGGFGIRCNAIVPGMIETPMIGTVPDKLQQMVLKITPLGRQGKPEEVAEACLFLASDRSSYLTGTTIDVSGGLFM